MISNIMSCCRKCFINTNETLYLEIRNNCPYFIYMDLEYDIGTKRVVKQSPPFKPGTFQRLTFPSHATGIFFKVFDVSQRPPGLLCAKYIDPISVCYSITGQSPGSILCLEVPC